MAGWLIALIAVLAGAAMEAWPGQSGSPEADARAFLERLEAADGRLSTLSATFQAFKTFGIIGDDEARSGALFYERVPAADDRGPAERRFAVHIERTRIGRRLEEQPQFYVFDDGWLVEKLPADRQFTKRQVAAPGETYDPLAIGEGFLTIPIGQRAAAVLDRFEAELRPPAEGLTVSDESLRAYAEAHDPIQLVLTPREGTAEAEDYERVRVWYRSFAEAGAEPIWLPVITRVVSRAGDVDTVVLGSPVVNEALEASVFDTSPPPPTEPWNVHIQPWRGDAGEEGGGA